MLYIVWSTHLQVSIDSTETSYTPTDSFLFVFLLRILSHFGTCPSFDPLHQVYQSMLPSLLLDESLVRLMTALHLDGLVAGKGYSTAQLADIYRALIGSVFVAFGGLHSASDQRTGAAIDAVMHVIVEVTMKAMLNLPSTKWFQAS